ncbi:MAG: hypothetical protein IT249_13665 [Chitinophagaceae bacterium]|nr:hypothetical protein [Chitinophagaceae bacterium]
MKYSQWIGIAAALMVIIASYLPWMEIPALQKIVTGMDNAGTNLGKPAKLHLIFAVTAIVFFLIPKVWAKRTNLIFCALGIAWAVRNFLLYARCEMGTCPERKYGLYIVLCGSVVMLLMALFPDLKIVEKKEP